MLSRIIITTSFILFTFINVFSQSPNVEKAAYIVLRDSTYKQGEVTFFEDEPNVVIFKSTKDDLSRTYYAREVLEIGLPDGRKYFSRTVDNDGTKEDLFLKVLINGKLNLLTIDGTLIVESDSAAQSVSRKNYQSVLNQYCLPCQPDSSCNSARFSRRELKFFINRYNAGVCNSKNVVAYGAQINYTISEMTLDLDEIVTIFDEFKLNNRNVSGALFYETFWDKKGIISSRMELGFGHQVYLGLQEEPLAFAEEIIIETNFISMNLIPKINIPVRNITPYFGLGMGSQLFLNSNSEQIVVRRLQRIDGYTQYFLERNKNFTDIPQVWLGYLVRTGVSLNVIKSKPTFISAEFGKYHSKRDYSTYGFSFNLSQSL